MGFQRRVLKLGERNENFVAIGHYVVFQTLPAFTAAAATVTTDQ